MRFEVGSIKETPLSEVLQTFSWQKRKRYPNTTHTYQDYEFSGEAFQVAVAVWSEMYIVGCSFKPWFKIYAPYLQRTLRNSVLSHFHFTPLALCLPSELGLDSELNGGGGWALAHWMEKHHDREHSLSGTTTRESRVLHFVRKIGHSQSKLFM